MTEAEKKDVVTMDSDVVQDKESEQLKEAVEQSEALMKFPMEFPIKVMGDASPAFPKEIIEITKSHFEDFDEKNVVVTWSRTRKYQCVTVTVTARSREQLDDMYRALTAFPMVEYAL